MPASRCPLCGYAGGDFIPAAGRRLACPRCGELFGGDEPKKIDVEGRTLTAGTAVAAVGGLTLLVSVAWLAVVLFVTPPPPPPVPGQNPDAARGYLVGYYMGQYVPPIFGFALGAVQTAGGVQFARRRTWPVAVVGSMAALLPCSCSFVVGLPIGIWALIVLFQPPIRAAFR